MSDTVKLVIEIPKESYEQIVEAGDLDYLEVLEIITAIENGTPLDSNSERAETQTYLAGHIKGWEQGREDLIDEILNKVSKIPTCERDGHYVKYAVYRILEEIINKE